MNTSMLIHWNISKDKDMAGIHSIPKKLNTSSLTLENNIDSRFELHNFDHIDNYVLTNYENRWLLILSFF